MMAMAELHARSRIGFWRALRKARSGFIACPRRSALNGTPTTTFWRERKRRHSTSPRGCNGSLTASTVRDATEKTLASVLRKARFWETHASAAINERQRLVLNKLLSGFEGKLTSSKWAKLEKCSQDTAHRDIQDLIDKGILQKDSAGGRSTSYSLKEPDS